jgi:membrane-bound lytic murein transglycosylase D
VSAAGWNKLAVNARLKPGQRITLMLPRPAAVASGSKRSVRPAARAKAPAKARPVAQTRTNKASNQKPRATAAKPNPARVASQKP